MGTGMKEFDPPEAEQPPRAVDSDLLVAVATGLPDAALLIDGVGTVLWGNLAAEELFGVGFEDGIGLNGLEFVHPDDLQMALLSLGTMQSKSVGTLLELRMRHADGTWRLMEMRGAMFVDGILLCIRDLTDRRRWEVAGDETSHFSNLLQNATTLMIVLEPDGVVARSSGGLTRLLGRGQEWLEQRPFDQLVDPVDRDALGRTLDLVRSRGASPVTVDLQLLDADDRPVPFAVTFTNHLDDPIVSGIVATGHDISDRVRTEQELRHANSVLAATLESTTDGILVVDNEGRITSFNSRFAELWQLPHWTVETRDDDRSGHPGTPTCRRRSSGPCPAAA